MRHVRLLLFICPLNISIHRYWQNCDLLVHSLLYVAVQNMTGFVVSSELRRLSAIIRHDVLCVFLLFLKLFCFCYSVHCTPGVLQLHIAVVWYMSCAFHDESMAQFYRMLFFTRTALDICCDAALMQAVCSGSSATCSTRNKHCFWGLENLLPHANRQQKASKQACWKL